jgi:hypothetical protein
VGSGEQKRDFVYVTDVTRALYLSAISKIKNDSIKVIRLHYLFLHQDYLGINTIAYGHVLLSAEISSNKIQISDTEYVTDWINKGLTDEEAFKLLLFDYKKHEKEVKRIIEAPRWNALPDMYRLALVDITYNGGGPRKFPKMSTAMGIPPSKPGKIYIWPSVIDFKLGPVDHEEVKRQFERPQVSNRDTAFEALFF